MYILLNNNIVYEIIPDEDPVFPGIPIDARYAPDFVAKLLHIDDSIDVEQNWVYDSETGTFSTPAAPDPEPTPEPPTDITSLKAAKKEEISDACHAAIVAGVDVELSDGTTGHFSLEETDQINLTTAYNAVQTGATGYPYHADGDLCKMYSAADIIAISEAATAHKLYHLTYCNHLLAWVKRAETPDELAGITYGADLPEDLAANMAEVLANASATA